MLFIYWPDPDSKKNDPDQYYFKIEILQNTGVYFE